MNNSARMLRFDVVDVFAARAFAGNPLAVVHDADGLDDYQLQTIARGVQPVRDSLPAVID